MKLLHKGKTKDLYMFDNENYLMKFKDDMTGEKGVFDPGANTVGLTMKGMGNLNLELSKYFFKEIERNGIRTHYIEDDGYNCMKVRAAKIFGKGIEVICRYRATGSFMRRYGMYAKEGQLLNALVEFTLKDDNRNDPPITKDTLIALGIMNEEEYKIIMEQTIQISDIIKGVLEKQECEIWDIKLEFGCIDENIVLIDEISGGNMRAFKDGLYIEPFELGKLLLKKE